MPSTARILRKMATFINTSGLHTGDQFAAHGVMDRLDICAVAYIVAEDRTAPAEFFTDEKASLRLIEASAPAMQAIRAISAALDTEPCVTEIAPGYDVPDYIEHVSNWAATPPVFSDRPPTELEVVGRLLNTAHALHDTTTATQPTRAAA